MKTEKLPASVETEKYLLSSLLQWPELIRSLDLSPDLFSREAYRRVYLLLAQMEEEGEAIDPVTVFSKIRESGQESMVGGAENFFEFSEVAITRANATHYAEILSRTSLSRKILLRLKEVQEASSDPEDAVRILSSILEMAEKTKEKTDDIVHVNSVWNDVLSLHSEGKKRGLSTGWFSLDENFTVRPGDLTVGTGIPGAGKSSFFDNLAVNMASNHNWTTLYFSAENFPIQNHLANLLEIYHGLPFNPGPHYRMDAYHISEAKEFFEKHFVFLDPQNPSVDRLLFLAKHILRERKIDQFIIDPWNQLSHDFGSISETQYIAKALAKIRRFARQHHIHVVIVAHPMKLQKEKGAKDYPVPTLYDIAGSAHFRNMADNGIVLWREHHSNDVQIHIQKVRFREVGQLGMKFLRYDRITGRFNE